MSDTDQIFKLTLSRNEAAILRDLVVWLDSLLEEAASEPNPDADFGGMDAGGSEIEPLDDPILARLLPDAYVDDPEASEEFARFTRDRLAATKRNQLGAVLADLSVADDDESDAFGDSDDFVIELNQDAQRSWLFALGDLRLSLHASIVANSVDAPDTSDSAADGTAEVIDWLAWLQESLLQTLNS